MRTTMVATATVISATVALAVSSAAKGSPDAEPPEDQEDVSATLAITHSDDVVIDDVGSNASSLTLVDPGFADEWELSGGLNGDFFLYDPDGFARTVHRRSNGDSSFRGRDDVIIAADGSVSGGGDITLTASATDGDIVLRADQDQTTVQSFGNAGAVAEVFRIQANVPPQQVFDNDTSGAEWFFAMTADDQFKVSRNGTGTVEAKFFDNGNLVIDGTLTQGSDARAKHDIVPVETAAVLDALASMPISTWQYLDDPGVTHLGPTAQDFAEAFELGATTTGIDAVDADGVALAAIQALNARLEAQNAELRADNAEISARLAELTLRLEALEADG